MTEQEQFDSEIKTVISSASVKTWKEFFDQFRQNEYERLRGGDGAVAIDVQNMVKAYDRIQHLILQIKLDKKE